MGTGDEPGTGAGETRIAPHPDTQREDSQQSEPRPAQRGHESPPRGGPRRGPDRRRPAYDQGSDDADCPPDEYIGEVKAWRSHDEHGGFGFIECQESHEKFHHDVFMHRAQAERCGGIEVGDKVRFRVMLNKKGQPQARYMKVHERCNRGGQLCGIPGAHIPGQPSKRRRVDSRGPDSGSGQGNSGGAPNMMFPHMAMMGFGMPFGLSQQAQGSASSQQPGAAQLAQTMAMMMMMQQQQQQQQQQSAIVQPLQQLAQLGEAIQKLQAAQKQQQPAAAAGAAAGSPSASPAAAPAAAGPQPAALVQLLGALQAVQQRKSGGAAAAAAGDQPPGQQQQPSAQTRAALADLLTALAQAAQKSGQQREQQREQPSAE